MALTTEDLKQIHTVVDQVVNQVVNQAVSGLATKEELKNFATKDDLKKLATKDDLANAVAPLATKVDLDRMEGRLTAGMGLLERDTFARLDQHEKRMGRLKQAPSS